MATTEMTADVMVREVDFPWWLVLLQGVASLLLGILLVTQPGVTLVALVIFLGIYWLIGGIFSLVGIFINHANWGWRLFTGILGIIAGLVVVRNPLWASVVVPTTLVWILAGIGIVIGLANLVRSFTGGGWGAALIGLISIILGFVLLMRPLVSLTFLVYLAGFWMIIAGIATIIGSLLMLRTPRPQLAGPTG